MMMKNTMARMTLTKKAFKDWLAPLLLKTEN
jgi:hypothetical protein